MQFGASPILHPSLKNDLNKTILKYICSFNLKSDVNIAHFTYP